MIPVSEKLNAAIGQSKNINFGLQFIKFVKLEVVEDVYKPKKKNQTKETDYDLFLNNYKHNTPLSEKLLKQKHIRQIQFLNAFGKKYHKIVIRAKLTSRLISGLGQTHPTETGLTLDYNLGIPYLPASSIKGIVRAARRFELNSYTDEKIDEKEESRIPLWFGDQKKMGRVIFMDAYPEDVPELEADILTPHYGDYYNAKDGEEKWPGDWMDPNPVKFLTVSAGAVYIFRALVDKQAVDAGLLKEVKQTYQTALCDVGIGGKTAIGYGRFEILGCDESAELLKRAEQEEEEKLSPEERYKRRVSAFITRLTPGIDRAAVDKLFNEWQNDPALAEDKDIARAFKPHIHRKKKSGEWTSFYKKVAEILDEPLTEENPREASPKPAISVTDKEKQSAENKLKKLIKKGSVSKKELKKLKKYKKDFPDLWAELEKISGK